MSFLSRSQFLSGGVLLVLATAAPASAQSDTVPPAGESLELAAPGDGISDKLASTADAGEGEVAAVDPAAEAAAILEADALEFEADRYLLDLYGFADFTYRQFLVGRDNQWRNFSGADHPSFAVGNFNVYLSSRLSPYWRALGEVRFTYLPHGAQSFGPDGSLHYEDATVADYTDLNRDTRVGGVKIERVWLELNLNQYVNVRAGQWLTPYGVWNVDHGSPVIITTQRPFAIGEQLFPESQTGLQLRGQLDLGGSSLEYIGTVSNGRGAIDEYTDQDGNKALGGRLALRSRPFGEVTLGASVYAGRFVEVAKTTHIEVRSDGPDLEFDSHRDVEADELSYAVDLRWSWEGLLVQSELVANEARFKEGARPPIAAPDPEARQPDFRRWGGYVLIGYRTPFWGIMPFTTLQYLDLTNTDALPPLWGGSWGVNVRPDPRVVLKLEYLTGRLEGAGSIGYRDPIRLLQAQVAWAF